MERQYIGARYVPKFFENPNTGDSTWLAGVPYEPLTIVTVLGNSYTSKKAVPSGIGAPNTAPEYWINTSNYSAQIDEYRQITEAVADEVDAVKEFLVGVRNVVCVSDSYGRVAHPWAGYLADMLPPGSTVFNASMSGYGFAPSGYTAPFLRLITPGETAQSVPADYDLTAVTDIIVAGGFNDRHTNIATIKSAISTFVQYAKEHYPNARLFLMGVGWALDPTLNAELLGGRYLQAYQEGAPGIVYVAGSDQIMHHPGYFIGEQASGFTQYVHPSDEGSLEIAKCAYAALNGQSYHVTRWNIAYELTPKEGVEFSGNPDFVISQDGDYMKIVKDSVLNIDIETQNARSLEIGSFPINPICGFNAEFYANGFVLYDDSNIYVPLHFMIDGGKLYFKSPINGAGTIHNIYLWGVPTQLIDKNNC